MKARALKPLIITQQSYLENILITNENVKKRVATTVYQSQPNPISGCKYYSWTQVSPPDRGTFGLSWLVDPNPGHEVIQFLTGQINFTFNWLVRNPTNTYFEDNFRLLLIIPTSNIGYEPWDVNGKRIEFEVPIPNRTTSGCFTLPGMYSQFVIESPSQDLEMELRITGYIPAVDPYTIGTFCLNNKVEAYTNSPGQYGIIQRTFNPIFSDFADQVIAEFTSNPGFACQPQ